MTKFGKSRNVWDVIVPVTILTMLPSVVHANVVWPALVLERRIITWWSIPAGLIVEFVLVLCVTSMKPLKSILAILAMNSISTVAGLYLIPLGGILIEIFPGYFLRRLFEMYTFNPISWVLTVVLGASINSGIELVILRRFTKKLTKKKMFVWLLAANLISVGFAAVSLVLWPEYNY